MIENNVLGKEGLTVTGANHLANIAKEMYESLESKVQSLKLYSRDYKLAVNGNSYRVENESDKSDLQTLSESLKEIGELKSLIAFLREAVKLKMDLNNESAFEGHVKKLIEEGRDELKQPEEKKAVTFADEFAKRPLDWKARYYALEAKAATIGGFVHPDGAVAKARKAFFEHMKNPILVEGKGQEAEINTFVSGFTAEEVDGEFFALQQEYRKVQAEFNKMKAEIDDRVLELNKEQTAEGLEAMTLWLKAKKVERTNYNAAVKALKVVIPQNLREIYEKVSAVANAR